MPTIYDINGNILFKDDESSLKELVEKNKFNLRGADLRNTNLSCSNLEGSNLRCADLRGADLRNTNLSGADLRNTNLSCSILSGANLSGADLRNTNLSDADLRGSILSGANLSCSILSGANLSGADLRNTNLSDADLTNAFLPIFSKWNISYMLNSKTFETSDLNKILIIIGCKEKTIKDWNNWFNSDEEFETKRGTQRFKQIYANYVTVREYLKIMVGGEN